MTYEEAMQFWFGRINYEHKTPRPTDLNLDRIRELLDRLDRPQERFPIVHIAGSKGKGSTSAMLASILQAAGYRVGLFTSPHLVSVHERIRVDGVCITEPELARTMTEIAAAGQGGDLSQSLTFFEISTALGFLHFARRQVEVAVVEVGMGGRFDSTNVCTPAVSVITSISFDHTKQLGNTLALIAGEKAGIIKPGIPAVSGVRDPEPRDVIRNACIERSSPLREIDVDFRVRYTPSRLTNDQMTAATIAVDTWRGSIPPMTLKLIGEHQAANAAVVVATVERLREQEMTIKDRAIADGLANVSWPARLECVGRSPLILLDCAHNIASADALLQSLDVSCPMKAGAKRILLFAGSRDKDLAGMLAVLAPRFDSILFTQFTSNPRAVPPGELIDLLPSEKREVAKVFDGSADALAFAQKLAGPDDLIVVTGSVFLAGELRPFLVKTPV